MTHKALLLGNGVFESDDSLNPLNGPRNDIELLQRALTHPEWGLHEADDVLTCLDKGQRQMLELMSKFFDSAGADDQLLLYYSGHGKRDHANNLFLCARDTRSDMLYATAVADGSINGMIQACLARAVVIILDCCHAGAFKGGEVPENLCGSGRYVLASCRAAQPSADAKQPDANSVFTHYLVETLLSEAVDDNGDGFVSLNEVYNHLIPAVRAVSKQIPQRHFDNAVGEVVLGRARGKRGSARPPTTELPELEVSVEEIVLRDVELGDDLPTEVIDVHNRGGGKLDWHVSAQEDWIEVRPYDVANGYFELEFRPTERGVNRGRVYVRDRGRGGSKRISITVYINPEGRRPKLVVTPDTLDFGDLVEGDQPVKQVITLHNTGGGSLNPMASCSHPLVELTSLENLIEVQVSPKEAGEVDTAVLVQSDGGQATVLVHASILQGAILQTKPPSCVDFGKVTQGERPTRTVKVTNAGAGELTWSARYEGDFFAAEREGDTIEVRLTTQEPKAHHGTLTIDSDGGSRTLDVRATVRPPEEHPPPPPPPGVQWPGRWIINMNAFGLATSQFVLDLHQNGGLSGQQAAFGMTLALQGAWAFDPGSNLLRIDMIGGGFADTLLIQLTSKTAQGFLGQDLVGRQFELIRG